MPREKRRPPGPIRKLTLQLPEDTYLWLNYAAALTNRPIWHIVNSAVGYFRNDMRHKYDPREIHPPVVSQAAIQHLTVNVTISGQSSTPSIVVKTA